MLGIILLGSLLTSALWQGIQQRYIPKEVVAICSSQETKDSCVTFPYRIQGTDLVMETLTFYEGPFLEDGTQEEVYDVAALVVRNEGQRMLERLSVTVHTKSDTFQFQGSWLQPGKACVLLETDRAVYDNAPVMSCSASCDLSQKEDLINTKIKITENEGRFTIANHSLDTLENLRIAYKTYLAQTDMYMGGITYEIGVDVLEAGKSYTSEAPFYVDGYSDIVIAYTLKQDE